MFAIVITLLILDIHVPRREALANGDLRHELLLLWLSLVAYLLSVTIILVMWVNHHRIFTVVRRTDQPFLLWNGLLLMFVTFAPFPTALLAEYMAPGSTFDQFRIAAVVHAGHGVLIALAFIGLWRHAVRRGRLLTRGHREAEVKRPLSRPGRASGHECPCGLFLNPGLRGARLTPVRTGRQGSRLGSVTQRHSRRLLMPEPAAFAGRRLVRIAVCLLLGTGVFVAYGALGAFFLLALVGGVLSAGVMVILGRRAHAVPLSVPDRFRGSMTADVINVSRVRVAGVGGLGMTIMALAIAYFIPQIGVSVALGLVGGVMGGAALIVYRRRHGPLHDDRGQIGGRSVLVARP